MGETNINAVQGENAVQALLTELDKKERTLRTKYTAAQLTLKDTRVHADNAHKTLVDLAIKRRDRELGKLPKTYTAADAAPINLKADEAIASAVAGQVKEYSVGDKVFDARFNDAVKEFWADVVAAKDKFWKAHPHLPEPQGEPINAPG